MKLILVRHGQTYNNAAHRIDTAAPGAVLTEEGWTQANDVVATLLTHDPQTIWASNLTRTQQTATPLATRLGLNININPGFREIQAGDLENGDTEQHYRDYSRTIFRWVEGDMDLSMPGAPDVTGTSVLARFDDAVRQVEAEGDQSAVVFAHGAVIAFWVGMRGGGALPDEFVPLVNTGVVVLSGTLDSGYRLESWMDNVM
ncbi:histidine phosphatase family protein [Trueperella bialowiezensis]|uniref:Phosphoglyceromutase n=1 Tax=Trueperella bialowiezensis TaxID=312285 RepID=A0A3S4WF89_9ACTO|nr:histidine phosphatase family protein [Trueperella bialowiezensis]VEI12547.1 Phosphoglyceromutase [Trueperella bialowiezensis]